MGWVKKVEKKRPPRHRCSLPLLIIRPKIRPGSVWICDQCTTRWVVRADINRYWYPSNTI